MGVFFPAIGYGEKGLEELIRVVKPHGPICIVDNAGDDAFCGLFERDISSDSSWWHKRGLTVISWRPILSLTP